VQALKALKGLKDCEQMPIDFLLHKKKYEQQQNTLAAATGETETAAELGLETCSTSAAPPQPQSQPHSQPQPIVPVPLTPEEKEKKKKGIRKKLKQIATIQKKLDGGSEVDDAQIAKLLKRDELESQLVQLAL
jgi:hypothetical protein